MHNFQTNKNKMRNCKSKTRADELDEEEETKSFPKKKYSKKMSMVNLDDDDEE